MKATFVKGALVGGIAGAVMAAGTVALAGTGIGGVFNLGVDNTVNGQTLLRGNTGGNPQLRVNNQQGTDSAVGILGVHSGAAGVGAGLQGDTNSTTAGATGIFGRVVPAGAAGDSNGVKGMNNGAGRGVYGQGSNGPGVYGNSKSGYGVWGIGSYGLVGSGPQGGVWTSTDGAAASGVYAQTTAGGTGSGVHGIHVAGFGTGAGVLGETNSGQTGATGVLARANATNPGRDTVAVRGINKSANQFGMGVWGSIAGSGWGVLGEAGQNGIGVVGKVPGKGVGVHGEAGTDGIGVKGVAPRDFTASYAGQFVGTVDVQGYLKLPIRSSLPPGSDCLYDYHRGRIALVWNEGWGRVVGYVCTITGYFDGWTLLGD